MSEKYQPQSTKFPEGNLSFSQDETIAILQETINQLEGIIEKLNAQPEKYSLPAGSFQTLISSTEELRDYLKNPQSQAASITKETSTTPPSLEAKQDNPQFRETESELPPESNWWNTILLKIRSILPESLNEKLSDLALTGILSGILVVVLFTFVLGEPPKSTEKMAQAPTVEVQDVPVVEPQLTPEQSLIVAIQNQIKDVISLYPEELVVSIQPDFSSDRAIVQLNDDWYNLSKSDQDELANKMLDRARELNFGKLEITDSQGMLLARTPVVGKDIIIFQRHK